MTHQLRFQALQSYKRVFKTIHYVFQGDPPVIDQSRFLNYDSNSFDTICKTNLVEEEARSRFRENISLTDKEQITEAIGTL